MPSQRRMKAFGLIVALAVLLTLYITSSSRQTRSSDFYIKTQEALKAREYEKAVDAENIGSRLKAAEELAKKSADERSQKFLDSVGGGSEKSVAGRVLMNQDSSGKQVPGVANVGGRPHDREAAKQQQPETEEEHEVEVELNAILKKSPIIIFSKTYCPHSKRAKHILLELYKIVPAPYVVELDEHPLGPKLQATLGQSTGRRTVPNILITGKSIGGGDEVSALHESGKLLETVTTMGGKRIMEAQLRRDSD